MFILHFKNFQGVDVTMTVESDSELKVNDIGHKTAKSLGIIFVGFTKAEG